MVRLFAFAYVSISASSRSVIVIGCSGILSYLKVTMKFDLRNEEIPMKGLLSALLVGCAGRRITPMQHFNRTLKNQLTQQGGFLLSAVGAQRIHKVSLSVAQGELHNVLTNQGRVGVHKESFLSGCCGIGEAGRGLALLAGLFSENTPVHIGAEFLALDSGEGFDVGAVFCWDSVEPPLLDNGMTGQLERPSHSGDTTCDFDGPCQRCLKFDCAHGTDYR
jgi:hypothetical protein